MPFILYVFRAETVWILDSFKGTVIAVDFLYIYLNKDRINPKDLVVEAILNFVSTVPKTRRKPIFGFYMIKF